MANNIPLNKIHSRSDTGIFVKHTDDWESDMPMNAAHRDDYFIFGVIIDGNAEIMVDFKTLKLESDEGIILTPGQVHCTRVKDALPEAWSVLVASDNISEGSMEKLERYSLSPSPVKFAKEHIADLVGLFTMLRRDINDGEFARAIVTAIVNIFCRSIKTDAPDIADRYVALTLRFKHLVEALYVIDKRPASYAARLNVSRVYLNEAVKATTGMSAGEYIRDHITVTAKRLLAHTSLNVSEIASKLGYDDPAYFQRMFRKSTGMSPSGFRKNIV